MGRKVWAVTPTLIQLTILQKIDIIVSLLQFNLQFINLGVFDLLLLVVLVLLVIQELGVPVAVPARIIFLDGV
jgi:hypothetical protein